MHNEPMRQQDEAEDFELRIVRALEAKPRMAIPADFAARITTQVPARHKVLAQTIELRTTRYGYGMLFLCLVVLLIAILALAPRAVANSTLWIGIEWTLCAQFILLAVWFGWRQERLG